MAINTDIFLGSGANLALVPETDLYFEITTASTSTVLTPVTTFTSAYSFVQDVYVGCVLDLYDASASTTAPASSHIVTANAVGTVTISPALRVKSTPCSTSFPSRETHRCLALISIRRRPDIWADALSLNHDLFDLKANLVRRF